MRLLNEYGFNDFGFVSCCYACDGIIVVYVFSLHIGFTLIQVWFGLEFCLVKVDTVIQNHPAMVHNNRLAVP
jgi:hypothetical protein